MILRPPYIVYLGDADDILGLKMASSLAFWRPNQCVGELPGPLCKVSTGLPKVTLKQAVDAGAKSLVLGFNNAGGHLDDTHKIVIKEALSLGLDIVNGLHDKLTNDITLVSLAEANHAKLWDIRHPTQRFHTGTGQKRTGKRLLTVGTDCSVGKMYTALAIERAMREENKKATFRATGQCGIVVSGQGVAVDCVVSDFISGAVESITPDNDSDHWDIIEGQGSLFQPAYAGVTLGLIHGAQPDALVICHEHDRTQMRGMPGYRLPSIQETATLCLQHAKLTNLNARIVGVSLNTKNFSAEAAALACQKITKRTGWFCFDPVRDDLTPLIEAIDANS